MDDRNAARIIAILQSNNEALNRIAIALHILVFVLGLMAAMFWKVFGWRW